MTETPLDLAFVAMNAAPENDRARLHFFARLADAELSVLLEKEAAPDRISPMTIDTEDGARLILAFDTEARLAEFADGPAPSATLPARALAQMLAGQDIGIALNLGAPSETIVAPEMIAWLVETLASTPEHASGLPVSVAPPMDLPQAVLSELDTKLARMEGLADQAFLVQAEFETGARGHLLAITGAAPEAEVALAQAIQDALHFSGVEAGSLDVSFLNADDPALERIAKVGLRFEIPQARLAQAPSAPGTDPEKPPKLR